MLLVFLGREFLKYIFHVGYILFFLQRNNVYYIKYRVLTKVLRMSILYIYCVYPKQERKQKMSERDEIIIHT